MSDKTFVCETCGTAAVLFDAWASWNAYKQNYELHNVFQHAHCDVCDGKTSTRTMSYKNVRCCDYCDREFDLDYLTRLADGDRICEACNKRVK
jgi:hypothetical protein